MITTYAGFLPSIQPHVPGVDPNIATDTIRNACRQFCRDSGAYAVDLNAVDLVADQQEYDMSEAAYGMPDNTEPIRITWIKINNLVQDINSYRLYQTYVLRWHDDAIPSTDITTSSELTGLKIRVVLIPDRIEDDVLPTWFLNKWQDAIIHGTLTLMFASKGMPYSDAAQATYHSNLYEEEVSKGKLWQILEGRTGTMVMHTTKPWLIK